MIFGFGNKEKGTHSPFFAPSTPTVLSSETPGGTQKETPVVEEHKANIPGTCANLINDIVGAGIVGIPYAIQTAGLVSGCLLVIISAIMTEKSLRMLIGMAKHSRTSSYESLCECVFGAFGFYFVAANMFVVSYGAMVTYLMVVKDTLPVVMGVDSSLGKRLVMLAISLTIMVPVSSQRDMADLAKTSRINNVFDTILVVLVAIMSPIPTTVADHGGFWHIVETSVFHGSTIFVGLGVLSFAFVCQHSIFIIAGSLKNPTRKRWATCSVWSLIVSGSLEMLCGVSGFLGFLSLTQGNILTNFSPHSVLANVARGLLGSTMLLVYPLESFVARHVTIVFLFQGRTAHEGNSDAAILSRHDRRIALTVGLYVLAVVPAVVFHNLGTVLSLTGAIGGSCLSYIGPGVIYLGLFGKEFQQMAQDYFDIGKDTEEEPETNNKETKPLMADGLYKTSANQWQQSFFSTPRRCLVACAKCVLWYVLGMPIWYWLAGVGAHYFAQHELKHRVSDQLSRVPLRLQSMDESLVQHTTETGQPSYQQQSSLGGQEEQATEQPPKRPDGSGIHNTDESHRSPDPTLYDFVVAIYFIVFGVVALVAGLLSLFL